MHEFCKTLAILLVALQFYRAEQAYEAVGSSGEVNAAIFIARPRFQCLACKLKGQDDKVHASECCCYFLRHVLSTSDVTGIFVHIIYSTLISTSIAVKSALPLEFHPAMFPCWVLISEHNKHFGGTHLISSVTIYASLFSHSISGQAVLSVW